MFKNQLILRIAFIHLVSKKRQTVVAMLGVMFGITVFIFQAGLITGLQQFMVDKIVNNSAHIHIYNEPEKYPKSILAKLNTNANNWIIVRNQKQKEIQKKLRNGMKLVSILEKYKGVEGAAPFLGTQAIVKAGFKELPVSISGINIDRETSFLT